MYKPTAAGTYVATEATATKQFDIGAILVVRVQHEVVFGPSAVLPRSLQPAEVIQLGSDNQAVPGRCQGRRAAR